MDCLHYTYFAGNYQSKKFLDPWNQTAMRVSVWPDPCFSKSLVRKTNIEGILLCLIEMLVVLESKSCFMYGLEHIQPMHYELRFVMILYPDSSPPFSLSISFSQNHTQRLTCCLYMLYVWFRTYATHALWITFCFDISQRRYPPPPFSLSISFSQKHTQIQSWSPLRMVQRSLLLKMAKKVDTCICSKKLGLFMFCLISSSSLFSLPSVLFSGCVPVFN